MKQIELYIFKAESNLLVRIAGRKERGFRFDENGILEMVDDGHNQYIERLKRKFEYTCEKYNLVKPAKRVVKKPSNTSKKKVN